ncbi:hypothetical protein LguiB_000221 [Lonicera macranthoides]
MLVLIFLIAMKPGFIHAVYSMICNLCQKQSLIDQFILKQLLILLNSVLCISYILFYLSLEPSHQQKDTPVPNSSMRGSFCNVVHSSA